MTLRLSVLLALGLAPAAQGGDFRGRILADNKPLAGVTVAAVPLEAPVDEARREALRQDEPKPVLSAITKADGTFSLLLPAPAGVVRLRVSGGGVSPALLDRVLDATESDDLGDLPVSKAAALSGRVVDAQGGPVVAATVTLRSGSRFGEDTTAVPVTTTTAADGSFKFADAREIGNQIRIEAPGFATAEMRGVRAEALRRPVLLSPGRAISGRVLLPDRRTPAVGTLVRFEGNTTTRWAEVRRDGSFLVDGVPSETGSLVADGGDKGRATAPTPEAGARASLVLAPTAGVRGRVVDVSTAAPVAGIRVLARCARGTFTGRSGADGRYEVRGLPPGSCRLSADDPRYVPWERARVTVAAGETEAHDVALTRAATLTGRVVDPDGRPVEGALGQIFRERETSMRAFFRAATGSPAFRSARDGTFKATRLAPGNNQRLTVGHDDFEARTVGGIALVPGGTKAGVTVVLSRGFTVRGIVKDERGLPLAGAEVELMRARMFQAGRRGEVATFSMMGGPGQRPKKTTGPDGRFEFHGLAAGDYTLVAGKKGMTRERVDPVKVTEGPEGEPVQMVLRAGAAISGFVRDKAGNGASGWVVVARPAGSSAGPVAGLLGGGPPEPTGPDGSFFVDGLTPGESYELQALSSTGMGPRKAGVVPPAEVDLQVSSAGRIRGTVVDDNGRPIPDFEVKYEAAAGGGMMAFRFGPGGRGRGPGEPVSVHADDGTFTVEEVAPGKWDVEVTAAGYQKGRAVGITVEEGGTAEGVEVRLVRGGTISGRVVEERSGKAVLEATVRAEPASAGGGRFRTGGPDDEGPATTDAEGRFQIEGLAPGAYTVTATHPAWTEETERVELKDQPAAVEIRLGRGGAIGGAVLAGGRGVSGASVVLSAAGQPSRGPFGSGGQTAITDEGGRFRFDTLSAGRYTLFASLRSQTSAPVEAVLQGGEASQEVSLILAEGAAIRGMVTGLAENARGNVMVSATGPEEYFANTRTAGDGSFELTGAPKGPISLRASSGDFVGGMRSATAQVVVAEGQTEAIVEIVFETGFRVDGHVTRGGRPVAEAIVAAIPEGGGGRHSSTRTDDTGSFVLEGLQEGSYVFMAAPMGAGGAIRKTVKVMGDATVDLEAPPAKIAGRIVEVESGRPVGVAMVRVEQGGGAAGPVMMMGSESDSSGRFAVENLEPRSYRVSVTKPAYQTEAREIPATEDSDVTFELRRGDGVGLVVQDGIYGTPLRGVLVRILDAQGATVFTGSLSLDSDGRGEIPSLRPGRYQVRIGADGYAGLVLPAVMVPALALTVALTPGGTLEIRVGPETLARPNASGKIVDSNGSVYYPFVFSPDGVVRLTGPLCRVDHVTPGRYTFAVDGGPRPEFEMREGGTAGVSLP